MTALSIINSSITQHLPTHYQLLCRHPSREELKERLEKGHRETPGCISFSHIKG